MSLGFQVRKQIVNVPSIVSVREGPPRSRVANFYKHDITLCNISECMVSLTNIFKCMCV